MRQHAPLVYLTNGVARAVNSVSPKVGVGNSYNEAWLQDLIFQFPAVIPLEEIDPSFGPLIPICKELQAGTAGYADIFFINANGMPTLVECKLWRNPEAPREVVGQIFDYARVLKKWTYNDLNREARKWHKNQNFDLAKYVCEKSGAITFDEATFCDRVSLNLERGRILLLIIGDRIREGVEAIGEYIQGTPGSHFTFGLVEMALYELEAQQRIVQSRILAKTTILGRSLIELGDSTLRIVESESDDEPGEGPSESANWNLTFWSELASKIKLDDTEQPIGNPLKKSNMFFGLQMNSVWITCYFSQRNSSIGVFLGYTKTNDDAQAFIASVDQNRQDIELQFAKEKLEIDWKRTIEGKLEILSKKSFAQLTDTGNRSEQVAWFCHAINAFVNVFRPRVAEFLANRDR
jgi:hypothetical protein